MKTLCILALALAAAPAWAGPACTPTPFGQALSLESVTPIAEILSRTDDYLGRVVRVEGQVVRVCENMGCWLELKADDGASSLRVKVKDGEIVFPLSARGHRGIAEGTLEAIEMTRDEYVRFRTHEAMEAGGEFDAAGVGDGPFRVLQVRGRGAEICL